MTKRRSSSLIVLCVAMICVLGVGATFAWLGFSASKETALTVAKVDLTVSFSMQDSLSDVARGDEVVDYIKFSPTTNTANCFVRARLVYKSDSTTNDAKSFLLSANYEPISTKVDTTAGYKWYRHTDGYYYLVTNATAVTPYVYTKTSAQFSFCENVLYKGAVNLYGTVDAPSDLRLFAEVQAVQNKNITDTSIANLSTVFTETFGAESTYGHIVAFSTGTDEGIPAQTFFNNTSTVTEPADPISLGKTFGGWYTDSTYTNGYNFDTLVTSSFTLYAKFS